MRLDLSLNTVFCVGYRSESEFFKFSTQFSLAWDTRSRSGDLFSSLGTFFVPHPRTGFEQEETEKTEIARNSVSSVSFCSIPREGEELRTRRLQTGRLHCLGTYRGRGMTKEIAIRWLDEIPQLQWDSVKGTTSSFSDAKYWIPSWRIKVSSNCENGEYKLLDVAIAAKESEAKSHLCLKACAESCGELCCNERLLNELVSVPFQGNYRVVLSFEFQFVNFGELLGFVHIDITEPNSREELIFTESIVLFTREDRAVNVLRRSKACGSLSG